ncbi:hypothetical protein C8N46_10187 [Kordia periserrulae]|uniref:DUF3558 domain-containing protein n=1 Tax=Kordia periserrulae TaxID=701523 RepID=A0A2T6C5C2_9FLAO|nr:hypothetical protein [Kordia periserrulae]PTX63487.1 hypothetical protein C8N46_10187 [Kordia periserrulae]
MKILNRIAIITLFPFFLTSCFGDKNTVVGQELGDSSFVNTNFSGNKKDFAALPKNMCEFISESNVKNLYPDATKVLFDDGKTFMTKSCRFLVYMGDDEYNYLNGTIIAVEEKLAEGEDWKETWELKKKMSKSSSFVSDLGQAAIWIDKKRELSVKLEGYMITITVPGSPFNEQEIAKKRDYKKIAVEIAKNTGLF